MQIAKALRELRTANLARQAEWDAGGKISLTYRGNELAGEAGEACNVIKKLDRERLGIRGSRASAADLAEELSDVIICVDLIASAIGYGVVPDLVQCAPDDRVSPAYRGNELMMFVGAACDIIAAIERYGTTDRAALYTLARRLDRVAGCVVAIARDAGIDLATAIPAKFNATSAKVGLTTRMGAA